MLSLEPLFDEKPGGAVRFLCVPSSLGLRASSLDAAPYRAAYHLLIGFFRLIQQTIFTLGVNSDSFEEEEELEEIEEFAIASGCSSLPSLLTFLSGEVRRVRPVQGISSFKRAVWSMLREAPSLPASVLASGASRLGLLFLAGDRSGAGKTSVSLGILSSLLEAGLHPRQIAYIKPATQCEGEQPIRAWCQENDVDCVDIGLLFEPLLSLIYLPLLFHNQAPSSSTRVSLGNSWPATKGPL